MLVWSRLAALSGCGYNNIQTADEGTKQAWAEVVNQYQRRADLIPNLVNTVKGYAQQEKDVLTQVTEARSRVGQIQVNPSDTGSLKQFEAAQADMGSALSRLLVVAENYPQLKSDQNFRELQAELAGTENRITVARKRYIDAVNALQRDDPPVPGQPDGDGVRLRCEAAVHRREREGDRQAAEGRFRRSRNRARAQVRRVRPPMRLLIALALLLGSLLPAVGAAQDLQPVPPLKARVTDLTGTLDAQQVQVAGVDAGGARAEEGRAGRRADGADHPARSHRAVRHPGGGGLEARAGQAAGRAGERRRRMRRRWTTACCC